MDLVGGFWSMIYRYQVTSFLGKKKVFAFFFFSELNCDTYSYNGDLIFFSPVQH